MNQIRMFITMLLAIQVFLFANAQNQVDMRSIEFNEEEQAVLDAVQAMTNAFHNKDIEGVMKSYEDDAVIVFEPQSPVSDDQILTEMFKGAFMLNPKFEYGGHEVFINGNIAMHIAPWKMNGQAPDGTIVEQSGLSIAILRKQENGEWLMIFDNPHGSFLMNKE